MNTIHNNKYTYPDEYINNDTKIRIICPIHGDFWQLPTNHMVGKGCQKCKRSKGEEQIDKYLDDNNIKNTTQKKFKNCIYNSQLPFDFYIPDYNICIEYDGIQHYEPIEYFGGIKAFKLQQKKDQIKNEYCKDNNIRLLRIKYNENIEEKLNNIIL